MDIETDPSRRTTQPSYAAPLTNNSSDAAMNPSNSPAFKRPEVTTMEPWWVLCEDVKEGTQKMREKRGDYLPRFTYEDMADWDARVKMTFSNDHYEQTLDDLVGLVMAQPPQLGNTVSEQIRALSENIDGRGSSLAEFVRELLEKMIDYGHAGIFTDYPTTPTDRRLGLDEWKARKIRPYWRVVCARDIVNWRTVVIGGEDVLTMLVLRETRTVPAGTFGTATEECFRVYRQEVRYQHTDGGAASATDDPDDLVPVGLGAITWELWCKADADALSQAAAQSNGGYVLDATGAIDGPDRIPFAVAYGGKKIGFLYSKPFLYSLAWTNLEETQVNSDYSWIMHIANVPTPFFVGRRPSDTDMPVKLGSGIDIPSGGSAGMLEPSGASLGATRTRIEDIRGQARRQGATLHADEQKMSATEAAIAARQRNARLVAAVQSGTSALEQSIAFSASLLKIPHATGAKGAKGGGSIALNSDFGQVGFDAAFVAECRQAWMNGALPLEAYLNVLKTGRLPEEFEVEKVALQMAARAAADLAAQSQQQGGDGGAPLKEPAINGGGPSSAPQDPGQPKAPKSFSGMEVGRGADGKVSHVKFTA